MRSPVTFGLFTSLLAACGSSSSTSDAGAAACASYASSTCDLYASCSNGWYIADQYGDTATCVARLEASCVRRLELPGTARTTAQVEACTTALSTASCEALYADGLPACYAPAGPSSAGTGCAAGAQCASAYCGLPSDQICSTCETAPGQGDSCATFPCGAGLHCLNTLQTCAPLVGDGGACNADGDCQFGLACLTKGLFCATTTSAGDACDYTGKVGPGCNARQGLVCVRQGDGGICELHALADAGQPCGKIDDGGVVTDCAASGLCQKSQPDAGTGLCQAAAADGTACNVNDGPTCLPPARCVPSPTGDGFAGTCLEPYSASCQSTGGTGTGGTTTGGTTSGGTTTGGGDGQFPASGTFVSTSADGGTAVNANLTNFGASLAQFLAVTNGYQFSMAAINGDGQSSATFSAPSGITSYSFTSSIVFPSAPVVGSLSSGASCGNVGLTFGTDAKPFLYNYVAQMAGANCDGQVAGGGSWNLTFTSVSAPGGDLGNFYTAHGSLQATLPDQNGNSGALNLTF